MLDTEHHRLAADFLEALTSTTHLRLLERQERVGFKDEDDQHREVDLMQRVEMPDGQQLLLLVEFKKAAYPRDVRLAAEQLRAYQRSLRNSPRAVPVHLAIAAEHLSDGARQNLRKSGISYFDSSGTLYFQHGTWLVDIERTPKSPIARRIGSVFTGAREQVVHATLHHWRRTGGSEYASGAELAEMAGTSPYTVSKTMQELERQDWIQTQGSGPMQRRRLSEPAALLDAWAETWIRRSEPRSRWYGYAPDGILRPILDGLTDQVGWAITGAAAANTLVRHISRVDRVTVIVPPGRSDDWADELGLRRTAQGANVVLVERSGAALQFVDQSLDHPGLILASPFVQYLDLLDGVGRNKELAAEFRQRYLKIEEPHGP